MAALTARIPMHNRARWLLTVWILVCFGAPAWHIVLPELDLTRASRLGLILAKVTMLTAKTPPFEKRWAMFSDLHERYRIPTFTDADGHEIVATTLVATPAPFHKKALVVWATTTADVFVETLCRRQSPTHAIDIVEYDMLTNDGSGQSGWPYFNRRKVSPNVCAGRMP